MGASSSHFFDSDPTGVNFADSSMAIIVQDVTIVNSTFSATIAVFTVIGDMPRPSYIVFAAVNITNCTFFGKNIFEFKNFITPSTVRNFHFSDNKLHQGSPLKLNIAAVLVEDSTFERNRNLKEGGVFQTEFDGSQLTVVNSTFRHNMAQYGGVLYSLNSAQHNFTNCTFVGNMALRGNSFWMLLNSSMGIYSSLFN